LVLASLSILQNLTFGWGITFHTKNPGQDWSVRVPQDHYPQPLKGAPRGSILRDCHPAKS